MAFVTKLAVLFLIIPLIARPNGMAELWQHNKWQEWIEVASAQGIQSPEAHYNLASQAWNSESSSTAVKNLFISSQLRQNPFKAWSDLSWISQIQSILFSQPSPIDSYRLRLFLIWNPNLKVIWYCSLGWLLMLILFLRWGRRDAIQWNKWVFVLFLLDIFGGGLLSINQANLSYPSYLAQSEALIPVFKDSDSKTDEPLLELPPGLVVLTGEIKDDRILIQEPLRAWVDQNKVENYPKIN